MELTNRQGLPESLVRAVAFPAYSSGGSDITVTQLINPPQMVGLQKKHKEEIVEDVTDRIWALFGSVAHEILERSVGEEDTAEERVFTTINGWKVSGQFDLITKDHVLQDFKTTSVWSVMDAIKNGKTEWEQQLNLLAALIRLNNYPEIQGCQIVAICRDWRNSESMRNQDYPRKVELIDVPLWDDDVAHNYLIERINLHMSSTVLSCTDTERWYKGEKWAVMKKGRKSALRLLENLDEAEHWCLDNGHGEQQINGVDIPGIILKTGITVEHRPGTYGRCENYCSVSDFCPQWRE